MAYYYTNNQGTYYYVTTNSTTSTNGYYTYNGSYQGYGKPKSKQDFKNKEVKHLLQKERGW